MFTSGKSVGGVGARRVVGPLARVVGVGSRGAAVVLFMIAGCLSIGLWGCAASLNDEFAALDDLEPMDNDLASVDLAREIEEADIIKLDGDHFYIANPYTGLRIIDVSRIDAPIMKGDVALGGRGVELFVRDDRAFVFTTADFFRCAGMPIGFDDDAVATTVAPDYSGSRLWVIDVSDKDAPVVVTTLDFDGFVSSTRRVGDVIYVAGDLAFAFHDFSFGMDAFVTSINIADPENVFIVETETFIGDSLDIHVTPSAMYIVGDDPTSFGNTLVTYVDITDPAGDIARRDQFRVPGTVENRFFVDEHDGVFRIVTEEFRPPIFIQTVSLYTYDITDPDDVIRLAELTLVTNESLRAVRFDGERGYAVTFRFIDPLFVLDLSDPENPFVAGELEVPGFSTHLVPLGDRLIGVGFDNTAGVRPAVALYDVSDPSNPTQLSRIVVGERFHFGTSSEATVDEKALRVLEDAGLILLPFSTFDLTTAEFVDALQIIALKPDELIERGTIEHRGLVRRADLLDDRIWLLSDVAFQTVDIDDLDEPASLATVDILSEQELLDSGFSICVDSARFRGRAIDEFFVGGGPFFGMCGGFGFFPMILMLGGLLALRFTRRR